MAAADRRTVRVMQWNVLADSLSDAFPRVDGALLEWASRGPRIAAMVAAADPDIGCFEEVDHPDVISRALPDHNALFVKKPAEASRDGSLLAVRRTAEVVDSRVVTFAGSNQTAILQRLCFAHLAPIELTVAVVHLKAKSDGAAARLAQAAELIALADAMSRGGPVIIGGDFNAEPASPEVGLLIAAGYRFHPYAMTTWKIRENEQRRQIDYIFYRGCTLHGVEHLIDEAKVPPARLPSADCPSDHIPLFNIFLF